MAIDVGYRHFDGAYLYHNEHEVGQAIRDKITEGKVKREDIFYCGKVRFYFCLYFFYNGTKSMLQEYLVHPVCLSIICHSVLQT